MTEPAAPSSSEAPAHAAAAEPGSLSAGAYLVGVVLAAISVLAFSMRPILVKLAYAYVSDPILMLALRMGIAMPFFLATSLWHGKRSEQPRLTGRDWLGVLALGFVGYYAASLLDMIALQYISAGLDRLLLFLYPTIVVLLSAIFLGKRPSLAEVMALVLTYAGVGLVVAEGLGEENRNLVVGAAIAICSSVMFAIYLVGSSRMVLRLGSVRFSAYATVVAAICGLVQFGALRPLSSLTQPLPVYVLGAAIAIGSTVIPVFMTSEALRRIGASRVALIGALGPVLVIFLGYFGLDEVMTSLQLCGAVLVMGGVLLVSLVPRRRR